MKLFDYTLGSSLDRNSSGERTENSSLDSTNGWPVLYPAFQEEEEGGEISLTVERQTIRDR